MVQIDKNLAYKRESHTASFTLLMYNLSKDDLIIEIKHKLALISTIKNTFRKVKLNDRLYEYLVGIEKSSIQIYSQIVLIGSDTYIYKLDKKLLVCYKNILYLNLLFKMMNILIFHG